MEENVLLSRNKRKFLSFALLHHIFFSFYHSSSIFRSVEGSYYLGYSSKSSSSNLPCTRHVAAVNFTFFRGSTISISSIMREIRCQKWSSIGAWCRPKMPNLSRVRFRTIKWGHKKVRRTRRKGSAIKCLWLHKTHFLLFFMTCFTKRFAVVHMANMFWTTLNRKNLHI